MMKRGALALSHTMGRSSAIGSAPAMAHGRLWHMQAGERARKLLQRWSLLQYVGFVRLNRSGWPVKWLARPGQVLTRWSNFVHADEISRSYTGLFTKYLS